MNTVYFLNGCKKGASQLDRLLGLADYLTTWCIILLAFYPITKEFIDLVLLTWLVFFISSWLIFVNPGKWIWKDNESCYLPLGFGALVLHYWAHVVPFAAACILANGNTSKNNALRMGTALAICILYIVLYDTKQMYGLPRSEVLVLGAAGLVIYCTIF